MRLNIYLQQAGVGSRREAERLVADGRVTINGVKATPTMPVTEDDKVTVDGRVVRPDTRDVPRLFCLNKPLDYLVTTYDSQGRATIYDLPCLRPPIWKEGMPRVMNVGRLDVNSEGLLLLSSDGPLAQALMNPKTAVERVYRVRVHGRLSDEQIERLANGVTVEGISYRGVKVEQEKEPEGRNTWYRMTLTEGKNREIRRLMEYCNCIVNRLIRVQYGPFKLDKLERGRLREVPRAEVAKLVESLKARGLLEPAGKGASRSLAKSQTE